MIPVIRQTPFPQYVLGTMSPYPIERKVIEMSHIAERKFEIDSWLSWYLKNFQNDRNLAWLGFFEEVCWLILIAPYCILEFHFFK